MHKVKTGEHPVTIVPLIGGAIKPPQHIEPEFVDCRGLEAGWGIKRSLAYQDCELQSILVRSPMQTLSEFLSQWQPDIKQRSEFVAEQIEEGRDMSQFLDLERDLRGAVDEAIRQYSKTGSVALCNLPSLEVRYLFHLRLLEGCLFAQFLDRCGFGEMEMEASDWIEFLAIGSWHEFIVHKWRYEFSRSYPPKT